MKLKFGESTLFTALVLLILGVGVMLVLPRWEAAENFVKMGTPAMTAAPDDVKTAFNTPVIIGIPVSWSAPWAGSCYLTADVRPSDAPLGEPETAEWEQYHLIRAKYEGRWWIQKFINVYVIQTRTGQGELRYAIADPGNVDKLDIYMELKCDDQLLDSISTSIDYELV